MTTVNSFAHRRNRDASIDSICLTCFRTVATADSMDKLIDCEEYHSCDPNSEVMLMKLRSHLRFQRSAGVPASNVRPC